ncbi:MAG: HAD family hydrolase [Chloroflexi bacterium]|nr:HAD family hydrolase [Chloroflexota bacterium]
MTLQGVIFDFDGTLADTLPLCFQAFREVLKPYLGREVSDAEIRRHFGPDEEGVLRQFIPDKVNESLESYLLTYEKLHSVYTTGIPGIMPMLDRLIDQGLCLAVVTGKGPRSAAISLDHLALAKFFSLVDAGSPAGERKQASIAKVLAHWGFPPQDVAYVGDMAVDMRAAKAAGVVPLGAAWLPATRSAELRGAGAAEVFLDPQGLVAWVESQSRVNSGQGRNS